ncbi:unnamed protein product [Ilex paraguariensis]|uniref:Protein kinase domain-containing protein n=1 Tax=Ilex paraguariensis TaxID=185542 RepID=A0ABC8SNX2_9AQUA
MTPPFPKTTLLFLPLLLGLLPSNVNSQFSTAERTILLNLKEQWGNPPLIQSWNSTSSPCIWPEIRCSGNGTVTRIILPEKNINGKIPKSICDLENLSFLDLSLNYIPGNFPTVLYSCSKLQHLDLSQNYFVGPIPADIDRLPALQYLNLGANNFTGNVPPTIGNLPELQTLYLFQNLLNGTFPEEIGNLSNLEELGMAYNEFIPMEIPPAFGKMKKLTYMWMAATNLVGAIPESLVNLTSLEHLDLSMNNLQGRIPSGLFLLKNLSIVILYSNRLTGEIPSVIESLNLTQIDISMNNLTGTIPEAIGKLQQLELLNLFSNQFFGQIPPNIGLIPTLKNFRVFRNKLSGDLPAELGLHSKLEAFEVSENGFTGQLPANICAGGTLFGLVAFSNNLTGEVPKSLGNCDSLRTVQLYNNNFFGDVPSGVWTSLNLTSLMLSHNSFSGELPSKVAWNLSRLELSNNNFSGQIPTGVSSWTSLMVLKASNNLFSGSIPVELTSLSQLITLMFDDYRRKKHRRDIATWKLTSFQRLDFTEVNILSSLTENNMIGSGGSGKVYRISVNRSGEYVAVKRIWSNRKLDHTLEKEFLAEIEILGTIRHSNIVKLMCCISSEDSKLLVYEFMENQSLDRWLHGKKRKMSSLVNSSDHRVALDWPTRLRIAIGAAQGLAYMHHDCFPPIIHRDVKSSNILLDSEFKARIADFGLAKILVKQGEPNTMSAIAGSFGYLAPEYAYTTKVNEKIDVYSFGVVLLELVTGREANDGDEHTSLAEWAWKHYGEDKLTTDALDEEIKEPRHLEEMTTVFKLGLICTSTLSSNRPSMKEVLQILHRCNLVEGDEGKKAGHEYDVAPLLSGDGDKYLYSYRRTSKVSHGDDDNLIRLV